MDDNLDPITQSLLISLYIIPKLFLVLLHSNYIKYKYFIYILSFFNKRLSLSLILGDGYFDNFKNILPHYELVIYFIIQEFSIN